MVAALAMVLAQTPAPPDLGKPRLSVDRTFALRGIGTIVTGTLIANPNITSSSPVSVIGADEVELRQMNTAEQIIRDLPGAVPSIGQNVNNGNGGASFVNLRGLGTNRNIVLLDGARIVPSGTGGAVVQDVAIMLTEAAMTSGPSSGEPAPPAGSLLKGWRSLLLWLAVALLLLKSKQNST